MSRPADPLFPDPAGSVPPLPELREPDVTGLALWAAVFMASSALLAFLATEPAHAWSQAAPAGVFARGSPGQGAAASSNSSEEKSPTESQTEAGRDSWH